MEDGKTEEFQSMLNRMKSSQAHVPSSLTRNQPRGLGSVPHKRVADNRGLEVKRPGECFRHGHLG